VVDRPRVLIALPNSVEAELVAKRLADDGLEPVKRSTPESATAEIRSARYDVLVADAALAFRSSLHILVRARNPQAVTILVGDVAVAGQGDPSSGQTIYLARPLDAPTVSCFVSMALIDGRPVRRSPRKRVSRFDASANGIRLHIIDVSTEGLRLEVPRDSRTVLPPFFNLRIPIVGVSMTVRRMWTHTSQSQPSTVWYGGALSHNRVAVDQAWRTFVDTVPALDGSTMHLAS